MMADESGDQRPKLQNRDEDEEIQNLLDIEEDPKLSAALKNLERKEEFLINDIERKRARKAELNTDVFNIVGFFSVFQGVIFTAVSQLKSDTFSTCGVISFPIILTGLAALVGTAALWSKFTALLRLEDVITGTEKSLRGVTYKVLALRRYGRNYYNKGDHEDWVPPIDSLRSLLFSKSILVILAVVLFSGIFVLSYFAILCDWLVIRKWKGGFGATSAGGAPPPSAR